MANLWERLTHLYGHKFTSTYGEVAVKNGKLTGAAQTWASGLRGINGDQLADGLRACVSRADPWPPSLPEFVALCKKSGLNDFGLNYTPQYYRPQEKRPERLLEPSDKLKQARRNAAANGIKALREVITKTEQENQVEQKPKPISPDERDYRLMVLLHMLRADYPVVARRLKVVRGYV